APSTAYDHTTPPATDELDPKHFPNLPFQIYEDPATPDDDLCHTPSTPPPILNRILPPSLTQAAPRHVNPQRQRSPNIARASRNSRASGKTTRRVRFQPYSTVEFLADQIEATHQRLDNLVQLKADPALLRETTAQLTLLYRNHREAVALQYDPSTDVPLLRLSSTLESFPASSSHR
ncbi:hypothetical protein BGW41_000424, partial [Actinomortierella wolfii]